MSDKWTIDQIPDLRGKTIIVTGANSGIGYDAARALAIKGGHVIIASRNLEKASTAVSCLRKEMPDISTDIIRLDLADLASVRQFAAEFNGRFKQLDILINNAGIMAIPRRETADGFEMQLGTNHLGHFALTGLLLKPILKAKNARVVTISSGMHRFGSINFDDLQGEQTYNKGGAYSQSKLANLLFAYELQRKFAENGVEAISVAAHPGYSATNLQYVSPEMGGSAIQNAVLSLTNRFVAQSSAMGALPTLYAAVAGDVQGGDFIGPRGFFQMRGYPGKDQSNEASHDLVVAKKLWAISEQLTGIRYNFLQREPTATND